MTDYLLSVDSITKGLPAAVVAANQGTGAGTFAAGDDARLALADTAVQPAGLDAGVAAEVADPASATSAALLATYARVFTPQAYGATGDGVADDTAAVQAALTAAGVAGGTVYFRPGTYRVTTTLTVPTRASLVGDGPGERETVTTAASCILWDGPAGGTVASFPNVGGIKIEGILFDGATKAANGIIFDCLRNSRIEGVTVARCSAVGILLTTSSLAGYDNSMFNNFTNIQTYACPIGVQVDGGPETTSNNCCHNYFAGLRIYYTGTYGLYVGNADNNTFTDLMTSRTAGTGYGIGLIGSTNPGMGSLCRSNYLHHVQGRIYAAAGTKNNFVYGYDQENGQGDPFIEAGADLSWMGNAGAVQQRYWSINQHIQAPNIVQKNHFVNGNFDVWTYGTTLTNPAANAPFAPRWRLWYNNTLSCTITREAFAAGQTEVPDNPRYYAQFAFGSGTATTGSITCKMENAERFNGESVYLSFYAQASTNRALTGFLKQNFGTGGSPSTEVSTTVGNVNVTTYWQKFGFWVPALPSTTGKTFGTNGDSNLILELVTTTMSGVLMLSHFKLERGFRSSPAILREVQEEEALCSRYVQKVTAQIGTTETVVQFPLMAKNPTVTGGGTGWTLNAISTNFLRGYQTTAAMTTLTLQAE